MLAINTLPIHRFLLPEHPAESIQAGKNNAAALTPTRMTKPQENKLWMMAEVDTVLREHGNAWQSHPAFVRAVAAFRAECALLDPEIQNQKGINEAKAARKGARRQLELLGAKVAAALHAYALRTDDDALAAEISINKTGLIRLRDELLPAAIEKITGAAARSGDLITTDGAGPEVVAALNTALRLFVKQHSLLRNAAQQLPTGETLNIGAHIAKAQHRLDIMDGLAGGFLPTNPDFVRAYRNARASQYLRKGNSD